LDNDPATRTWIPAQLAVGNIENNPQHFELDDLGYYSNPPTLSIVTEEKLLWQRHSRTSTSALS
jgi:hypothetical protein